VVATILAWLLGAGREPAMGFVLLAVTAGTVGALTTPIGALSSATQCWAFYTGFILNRFGVLTFDHRSLVTLAVMALAGVLPSLFHAVPRPVQVPWAGSLDHRCKKRRRLL
jgi:hypothetical protein